MESVWNLLQNPYDTIHFALGMLLHYLGKLKIHIICRYSADMEENANNCILIASNFGRLSHNDCKDNLLKLIYFCDQYLALKIRHSRRHCSVRHNRHNIQRRRQDSDKKFYLQPLCAVPCLRPRSTHNCGRAADLPRGREWTQKKWRKFKRILNCLIMYQLQTRPKCTILSQKIITDPCKPRRSPKILGQRKKTDFLHRGRKVTKHGIE